MPGTPATFTHEESVAAVLSHFDAAVDAEHQRMVADPVARVAREVHERFLARFVRPGMRVLEVGAGTGRFTGTLLELGARVVVTDLSPAQLTANRAHVATLPGADRVESWQVADVCDLTGFPDGGFDAAVAYGGPLSYAFDRAEGAAAELLRVTRPGGPVVASVMSTLGTVRALLPDVLALDDLVGPEVNDRVLAEGDLRPIQRPGTGVHTCRMFRADQLRDLLGSVGAQVLAMSASTWTALGHGDLLAELEQDPVAWDRYLRREVEACAAPGALDGGTHLLAAFGSPP
jgi:ubiquinone/menaquinone biosynthesis C-methylase UbiE